MAGSASDPQESFGRQRPRLWEAPITFRAFPPILLDQIDLDG